MPQNPILHRSGVSLSIRYGVQSLGSGQKMSSPFTALKIASHKPQSHWEAQNRRDRHEPHRQCGIRRSRLQLSSKSGPSVGFQEARKEHGWVSAFQKQPALFDFPICSEKQPGQSQQPFMLTFVSITDYVYMDCN